MCHWLYFIHQLDNSQNSCAYFHFQFSSDAAFILSSWHLAVMGTAEAKFKHKQNWHLSFLHLNRLIFKEKLISCKYTKLSCRFWGEWRVLVRTPYKRKIVIVVELICSRAQGHDVTQTHTKPFLDMLESTTSTVNGSEIYVQSTKPCIHSFW